MVAVEENYEEGKGIHVHILMQLTTEPDLSRAAFVRHFNSECVNIAAKSNKEDLMAAIGYVAKTGNYIEWGVFEHRGVEIKGDAKEYRFMRFVGECRGRY